MWNVWLYNMTNEGCICRRGSDIYIYIPSHPKGLTPSIRSQKWPCNCLGKLFRC